MIPCIKCRNIKTNIISVAYSHCTIKVSLWHHLVVLSGEKKTDGWCEDVPQEPSLSAFCVPG